MMTDPAALVRAQLDSLGVAYEVLPCDPELADTAAFCAHYAIDPADSANTIMVVGKADSPRYVACVVLATTRLDVNGVVRRHLGTKKASFASADETRELTGMIIGGVTAFGLPADLEILVDSRVMERGTIILGGGSRDCKISADPAILTANPRVTVVEDLAKVPTVAPEAIASE